MARSPLGPLAAVALSLALAATAVGHPLMTKSQAKAIVRDVNLTALDMPGYESEPAHKLTSRDLRDDAKLARCAGSVPMSKSLAFGTSPYFIHGNLDDFVIFGSAVIVRSNPTGLVKDLRALRSVRWRNCMRAAIISAFAADGRISTVTVSTLRTNVAGVFGYRFRIVVATSDRTSQPSYLDFFFMGTRSTEVRLVVNSSPDPPMQKQDDDVLRIVRTRLQARADPNAVL